MRFLTVPAALLAFALTSSADPRAPFEKSPSPPDATNSAALDLPVGRWRIDFANGVAERCDLHSDGTAFVVEPKRSSGGKAAVKDDTFVIVFDDDRVERWTPVGKRMVVEHWFPGNQFPSGARVLGIGKYSR